jgi:hypothetical protein
MSNTPRSLSTTATATGPFVAVLRWYQRVAGLVLALLSLVAGLHFASFVIAIATEGPFFVMGLGAFVDSFGKRVHWLFSAVLALVWCTVAFGFFFVFTGPGGPPVWVPIISALLALLGLVIVPLAYRARE